MIFHSSDGSGSKIFVPGQVGSTIYGLGLKNFPWKCQIFQFLPFGSKKISSGQVKKYPGQRRFSLLFTAGQKCQGPSLFHSLQKSFLSCMETTYHEAEAAIYLKSKGFQKLSWWSKLYSFVVWRNLEDCSWPMQNVAGIDISIGLYQVMHEGFLHSGIVRAPHEVTKECLKTFVWKDFEKSYFDHFVSESSYTFLFQEASFRKFVKRITVRL